MLGAGGRLGSRALAAAVHAGTAFVRSAARLRAAVGEDLLKQVAVVEGDVTDATALGAAMAGHEACIQVQRAGRQATLPFMPCALAPAPPRGAVART